MTPRLIDNKEGRIHEDLAQMYRHTDKAIEDALTAFSSHDLQLAQQVVVNDDVIDNLQHQIEDQCFSVIAMHQPVASDLRDIVSDIHIAIEMERIADHAADIASIVLDMSDSMPAELSGPVNSLGEQCREMLARMMDAYNGEDYQLARQIAAGDEKVDHSEQDIIEQAIGLLGQDSETNRMITQTIWIAHNIERIGDRITNIAEQIVYLATGDIVDLND